MLKRCERSEKVQENGFTGRLKSEKWTHFERIGLSFWRQDEINLHFFLNIQWDYKHRTASVLWRAAQPQLSRLMTQRNGWFRGNGWRLCNGESSWKEQSWCRVITNTTDLKFSLFPLIIFPFSRFAPMPTLLTFPKKSRKQLTSF